MQKDDSELETRLYLAFVYSGTLKDFEALKDYAAKFTNAKLIFQRYSLGYLRIEKEMVKP